jgi:hypothetical protein
MAAWQAKDVGLANSDPQALARDERVMSDATLEGVRLRT